VQYFTVTGVDHRHAATYKLRAIQIRTTVGESSDPLLEIYRCGSRKRLRGVFVAIVQRRTITAGQLSLIVDGLKGQEHEEPYG
jgi:hypothetical protein